MPEAITSDVCHKLRKEIFASIFPRWILMSVGGAFILAIVLLYKASGENKSGAADALKKAENNETKFTLEIQHVKEGQKRIERQLTAQDTILRRIDKKVNGD